MKIPCSPAKRLWIRKASPDIQEHQPLHALFFAPEHFTDPRLEDDSHYSIPLRPQRPLRVPLLLQAHLVTSSTGPNLCTPCADPHGGTIRWKGRIVRMEKEYSLSRTATGMFTSATHLQHRGRPSDAPYHTQPLKIYASPMASDQAWTPPESPARGNTLSPPDSCANILKENQDSESQA